MTPKIINIRLESTEGASPDNVFQMLNEMAGIARHYGFNLKAKDLSFDDAVNFEFNISLQGTEFIRRDRGGNQVISRLETRPSK